VEFESLWRASSEDNAKQLVRAGHEEDSRDALAIRTVLEAKLHDATRSTATWTRCLALATFILAAATAALAVVAALD
jgi:hypothetical protein